MKRRAEITQEAIEWYKNERRIYLELCNEVIRILKTKLTENNILYNDMSYRAKEIESYRDKCYQKKYSDPINEIYDMAGVRITTYTTAEVKKIKGIIESNFIIDNDHYSDKSETIEVDRFGYLSVHYIAELKDDAIIPEHKKLKKLKFEIQVRTLLQHAWSEVEHDRNYKFNGVLPKELKRRFYRLAGILELVDNEFERLSKDVEEYKHELDHEKDDQLDQIKLSRQSINEFFSKIYVEDEIFNNSSDEVIHCLKTFGIHSIVDLNQLYESICPDTINEMIDLNGSEYNVAQLVRDILIVKDAERYFEKWGAFWGVEEEDIEYFKLFNVDIESFIKVFDKDKKN